MACLWGGVPRTCLLRLQGVGMAGELEVVDDSPGRPWLIQKIRLQPLSWSSPSSQSLVLLARRQLCTSSLQMLAGRRLLSPAASLPVRRRPTAVDCSWHRDLDPPLIAVAKRCEKNRLHHAQPTGHVAFVVKVPKETGSTRVLSLRFERVVGRQRQQLSSRAVEIAQRPRRQEEG